MKHIGTIAVLAVGGLIGWILGSNLPWSDKIAPGSLISAATTITVAWWIQQFIRRRSELDKIGIERVSRFFDRVDSLISDITNNSVSEPNAEDTQKVTGLLRSLSNELNDLRPLTSLLDAATAELNDLTQAQIVVKRHLTDQPVSLEPALRLLRLMRLLNLTLRWKLCQQILAHPDRLQSISREAREECRADLVRRSD